MSEKKVGKRLLTWVLVLVMTLSLLPLNVLAVEGDPATDGGAAATDDKLHFTKEATLDPQTGEIIVHMEAWATGEVTTNTSTEALDIALVLDVSGSMKENFIQEESKYVPVYNLDKEKTGICEKGWFRICQPLNRRFPTIFNWVVFYLGLGGHIQFQNKKSFNFSLRK